MKQKKKQKNLTGTQMRHCRSVKALNSAETAEFRGNVRFPRGVMIRQGLYHGTCMCCDESFVSDKPVEVCEGCGLNAVEWE